MFCLLQVEFKFVKFACNKVGGRGWLDSRWPSTSLVYRFAESWKRGRWSGRCIQCFCSVPFVAADWNLSLFLRKLSSVWVDSVNLNSHQRISYTYFVKIRMHLCFISMFFMQILLAYHMTQRLRIHIRKVSGHRCSFVLDFNAFFKNDSVEEDVSQ